MSSEVVEGTLVEIDGAQAAPPAELVPVSDRWMPKGKAAAALMGQLASYDKDGRLSAEAQAMYDAGEVESTANTMAYQFLRFVLWCYENNLEPLPTDKVTCQEWIAANYTMKRPDGKLRGRKGQPYAPATVRLSLSAIARAHRRYFTRNPAELARYFRDNPGELEAAAARRGRDRGAMPTPTAHEDVTRSMKGYAKQWKKAGYREDVADSITVDELYAMVRTCDIDLTVQGLRDAFLMRLASDIGRRNSELMSLDWADLRWVHSGLLRVTIPWSKTNQDATAGDVAPVEADTFLEPSLDTLRLGLMWKEECASRGFKDGPVFRQVRGTGVRRKDGSRSGVILAARMTKKNYIDVVAQAARLSGVNLDAAGDIRHIVPHSLRVYFARRSFAAGVSIGVVCDTGGWSRSSPVVINYDRQAESEREGNTPGARIREAEQKRRDAEAARAAAAAAGEQAR